MASFNRIPDRVAVFNDSFQQVFPFARPIDVRVLERSQLFDHPIETGQPITDYAIEDPIGIEISFLVEGEFYQQMYQQIRTLYKTKEVLTVQTSAASYPNMVIEQMPHQETPELFDALPIRVAFRQAQLVPDPSTYSPADATQDDTEALGQQNGYGVTGIETTEGTQTVADTAYSSVPPARIQATGVQTINGAQTINIPTTENIPVIGVQTLTPEQSLQAAFR